MISENDLRHMYDQASASELEGAKLAASVYRRLLDMAPGGTMKVSFLPGEEFRVVRTAEGFEIA